ncbi:MAG: methylmalonyl Co-A mutase-associated GTPase MeaB [Psychroflexus sp.]|nr:methylmalonyl Co-A mutase-associated GTPase MeaB [Psychroflexus sp.]
MSLAANNTHPSALGNHHNSSRENLSKKSADRIKKLRRQKLNIENLTSELRSGNITALSQAITLIESQSSRHQEAVKKLIENCLPHAGNAIRIGITGVPGVGKSSFIESFGLHLISQGHKVAVLAVDPSSSISGGSILGDKTRMEKLVQSPQSYIRPTASGTSLGGVSRKTRESITLCEAAGYDIILIETVGVGQSETLVHSMTDFFLLLKLAGAGDELQGIKRGIIEMADAIVINKADGDNIKQAKNAKLEFNRALQLYPPKANEWKPKVILASALEHQGIDKIWKLISRFMKHTKENDTFEANRAQQSKYWLTQSIEENLKKDFYGAPEIKIALEKELLKIEQKKTTAFEAAYTLLELYRDLNAD